VVKIVVTLVGLLHLWDIFITFGCITAITFVVLTTLVLAQNLLPQKPDKIWQHMILGRTYTGIRWANVGWRIRSQKVQIHIWLQCGVASDGRMPIRIENLAAKCEWLENLRQLSKRSYIRGSHVLEYCHVPASQDSHALATHSGSVIRCIRVLVTEILGKFSVARTQWQLFPPISC